MKIELVSLVSLHEKPKLHIPRGELITVSRRRFIHASGLGVGAATIAAPTLALAQPARVAIYLFRAARLADTAVKVSEEIRAWIKLINDGGEKRLQQVMVTSLKDEDGVIEDQGHVDIESPPDTIATYDVTATANSSGSKTFDFRTEADRRKLRLFVES